MFVGFDEVVYAGSNKLKNGKEQLILIEGGKVRKVIAENVVNGVPIGSKVSAVAQGVSSIFVDFGDIKINCETVELREL